MGHNYFGSSLASRLALHARSWPDAARALHLERRSRGHTTTVYRSASPYGKQIVCIRSKAWLAASVWLRLARLPPHASRVRRSRHLRDTPAAAPGLFAHASVTEIVRLCPMGPKLRYTTVPQHTNWKILAYMFARGGKHQACRSTLKVART
jgi:hypothetical protein